MTLSAKQVGPFACRSVNGGNRQQATLLWVHGLGESGLCFERLLTASALEAYRHLAPDLIGYGRSLWRAQDAPLSLQDHAEKLNAFITQELAGPVVVIGHSMGGVIGQLLCEAKPQSVAAFVNIEGNLSLGDCGYSSKAEPQTLADFTATGMTHLLNEIYRIGIDDEAHRTYFASCCLCRPETFHLNSVELVTHSKNEDLAHRFAQLELPKAFLQGSPNGAPPRSADLLRLEGVEPVTLSPAGHWPFIDQYQSVVDWLASFLSQLNLPTASDVVDCEHERRSAES